MRFNKKGNFLKHTVAVSFSKKTLLREFIISSLMDVTLTATN